MKATWVPAPLRVLRRGWAVARTLFVGYGMARSFAARQAVDATGAPIPWFTYPALEYIAQFNWTNRTVFEFGCGHSSLFWASRASQVVSVENDPAWHAYLLARKPSNLTLHLRQQKAEYLAALSAGGTRFDVVAIDGMWRNACLQIVADYIADGGIVVLDDSDRHYAGAEVLRNLGFLQVDFSGFSPILAHTKTTSIFFRETGKIMSVFRSPVPIGGLGDVAQIDD